MSEKREPNEHKAGCNCRGCHDRRAGFETCAHGRHLTETCDACAPPKTERVRPAPKPTTADDLHRLCAKGHADGCVVLPGRYADACRVSSSDGSKEPYIVILAAGPLHGCDCPGYEGHGRCKHYAIALEDCGWLPDLGDTYSLTEAGREVSRELYRSKGETDAGVRRAAAAADLAKQPPSEWAHDTWSH